MIHLGIDFGTKNIGLALSDELGKFSIDLPIIKNNDNTIITLLNIINDKNIKQIVMGLPGLNRENDITNRIKKFADKLKNASNIDIIFWDESYTSINAEIGYRGKKRKSSDSRAARIILQEYLDFKNSMKI